MLCAGLLLVFAVEILRDVRARTPIDSGWKTSGNEDHGMIGVLASNGSWRQLIMLSDTLATLCKYLCMGKVPRGGDIQYCQ